MKKSSQCCARLLDAMLRGVAALTLSGACAAFGQIAAQPPADYKGPSLFGVCVYILADTSYYSNVFSTSGYFKFKAQEAFRNYATGQAKGAPLKGSACRWSTSQEEVSTQKEADKRLLGLNGRSAKGVETGWTFDAAASTASSASVPGAAGAPSPAGAAPIPTAKASAATQAPATSTANGTALCCEWQSSRQFPHGNRDFDRTGVDKTDRSGFSGHFKDRRRGLRE